MKKNYKKPTTDVYKVEQNNVIACSLCDRPGNHYGHHKNERNVSEEAEVSHDFLWDE